MQNMVGGETTVRLAEVDLELGVNTTIPLGSWQMMHRRMLNAFRSEVVVEQLKHGKRDAALESLNDLSVSEEGAIRQAQ